MTTPAEAPKFRITYPASVNSYKTNKTHLVAGNIFPDFKPALCGHKPNPKGLGWAESSDYLKLDCLDCQKLSNIA
jgi:hypothetical protein